MLVPRVHLTDISFPYTSLYISSNASNGPLENLQGTVLDEGINIAIILSVFRLISAQRLATGRRRGAYTSQARGGL